jgi:RNA polymerase sigma-B factor
MATFETTPHSRTTESELVRRYTAGDIRARDELLRRLLPTGSRLARRYARSTQEIEDLEQVACVGLLKAIDRFDPAHGGSLGGYAAAFAAGEVKRWFRDHSWSIKVSRGAKDLLVRIEAEVPSLAARLGRSPTITEIATALDVDHESVLEALEARTAASVTSLDQTFAESNGSPHGRFAAAEERGFEGVEMRSTLEQPLRDLSRRERLVLDLRFSEGLSQAEIGAEIGVSQMQVSRILRRALERAASAAA